MAIISLFLAFSFFAMGTLAQKIDCELEAGVWSQCDPCTGSRSRYWGIVKLPQFSGRPCPEDLIEVQSCAPSGTCRLFVPSSGEQMMSLMTSAKNGSVDPDLAKCQALESVPYLDIISGGTDITSSEIRGRIFDNHRPNAQLCRRVVDTDDQKLYQLPYNLDNMQFAVQADGEIQVNKFSSNYEFTSYYEDGAQTGFNFSIQNASFPDTKLWFNFDISFIHSSTFSKLFKQLQTQTANVFQVSTEVTLGQFIYKKSGFQLSKYFLSDMQQLPLDLDHNAYFNFFRQYGTHYIHSGVLGGLYEYFYVYKDQTMDSLKQNTKTLDKCLKISAGIHLGLIGLEGGFADCKNEESKVTDSRHVTNSADKRLAYVQGGTAEVAGQLAATLLKQKETNMSNFRQWVLGVRKNPVVIKKRLRSICDLIMYTDASLTNRQSKFKLCVEASKDYYEPYQPVKCLPCHNGGSKFVLGGECVCACQSSFYGDLCEKQWAGNSKERKTIPLAAPIKLIMTNGVSHKPSYLQIQRSRLPNGGLLRVQKNKIYHLISDQVNVRSVAGVPMQGEYKIQVFNVYLKLEKTIDINFISISECTPEAETDCRVHDFDVDCGGRILVSLGISDVATEAGSSSIHFLDNDGKSTGSIQRPCAQFGNDWNMGSFISATCDQKVVLSCPRTADRPAPVVLKIVSYDGKSLSLTPLPDVAPVTSLRTLGENVWIHSETNEMIEYSMVNWVLTAHFVVPGAEEGKNSDRTQFAWDFLGNFVVGQQIENAQGSMVRVVGGDKKVLATLDLDKWSDCFSVAVYGTKLFLSCHTTDDPQPRALISIDYLK